MFPTNLDLANNLGDVDFDFENFLLFACFSWIPNYKYRFPDFQNSGAGFGPGLRPGLGLGNLMRRAIHQILTGRT